jgi:hypothetical protein
MYVGIATNRWLPFSFHLYACCYAGGKTLIFIDEIDALAPSREKGGGAGQSELHNRIVATFLTLLDGVKPSEAELGPQALSKNDYRTCELLLLYAVADLSRSLCRWAVRREFFWLHRWPFAAGSGRRKDLRHRRNEPA